MKDERGARNQGSGKRSGETQSRLAIVETLSKSVKSVAKNVTFVLFVSFVDQLLAPDP